MKQPNAKPVYNSLFQEYSHPGRAITGRDETNSPVYDKGISCHVFAIASPISWEKANEVNSKYSDIGTQKEIERLQARFNHEFNEEEKKEQKALEGEDYEIQPYPEPSEEEILQERLQNMQEIQTLSKEQEVVLPVDDMYLCGGFREGKVTPEHMWIEDHTNNITYDTFINRGGIAVVDGVGDEGLPFMPGCEGSNFEGNEINRVKVDGYTWGQLLAIASGAESIGFPPGIKNAPQVLAAQMAVNEVQIALSKIPRAALTHEEKEVITRVYNEQELKTTQKEIDDVVNHLDEKDKQLYDSGREKLETVGKEQRRVAREIVGRGPEFFLEQIKIQQLTETANKRIEATLAMVHDENVKNYIKKVLEKKIENILAAPNPTVALNAFNKSMSNENITVLAKGVNDGVTAIENSVFSDKDPAQKTLAQQVKVLIASYANNDGKLGELSLDLTTKKNQLAAGPYADVLALTKRIEGIDKLPKEVTTWAKNLETKMQELTLEQRANFPNGGDQATLEAVQTLISAKDNAPKIDLETPNLAKIVETMLNKVNNFIDKQEEKNKYTI
ncbi:hypothetical protein Lgra_2698 [Legionella gratiana]|uniref:Uncharacterized protein n=1 Tax=Legionella gratiana TaxID=45066 RepID=A0A378J4K8_9GAMM|nr:hypothetical protein [Legionella gratiana]KTD05921.1 hypothetical protein Lgra_2698 [Legionella gratiana]STX42429.1 Uncharacterised protein [Legionella gratiana]